MITGCYDYEIAGRRLAS